MNDYTIFYPLIIAAICLALGYYYQGDTNDKSRPPIQKIWQVIKWISIIIIALYILLIVAAFTDGIGDLPLLGGGYVWVTGHWRRKSRH